MLHYIYVYIFIFIIYKSQPAELECCLRGSVKGRQYRNFILSLFLMCLIYSGLFSLTKVNYKNRIV